MEKKLSFMLTKGATLSITVYEEGKAEKLNTIVKLEDILKEDLKRFWTPISKEQQEESLEEVTGYLEGFVELAKICMDHIKKISKKKLPSCREIADEEERRIKKHG